LYGNQGKSATFGNNWWFAVATGRVLLGTREMRHMAVNSTEGCPLGTPFLRPEGNGRRNTDGRIQSRVSVKRMIPLYLFFRKTIFDGMEERRQGDLEES
jgi:hypothetical protein